MLDFGYYNMDCMEGMRQFPDKFFDLAIVDPPYGINISANGCGSRSRKYNRSSSNAWDKSPPGPEYFEELFRVSRNQIIWGMNHFNLPQCKHFIVWDKKQPDGVTFAQAELAWGSFGGTSKIFRLSANGQRDRIHPAQKPVKLYEWLVQRYAEPAFKVLDTHVGSGSSLIAFHRAGLPYVGFEIDKDYYGSSSKRLAEEMNQANMFSACEELTPNLFTGECL